MAVKLAGVFSDHMVLQRNIRLPIWGWADPGEKVVVSLAGRTARATAGADGKWMAKLPPLPAGGPYELTVAGRPKLVLRDVMIGEVWVCSGQSNMEWRVAASKNAAEESAAADYPNLRFFSVPLKAENAPQGDVRSAWERCSPESVSRFSAVGYFFGREIHRRTGLPVGLINASWGGTYAEAWTSRKALMSEPLFRRVVEEYEYELAHPTEALKELRAKQEEWAAKYEIKDVNNVGEAEGWHEPGLAADDWKEMDLPRNWQSVGHRHSGVFWFRREVTLPDDWAGRDLALGLGALDKSDVTYFNGVRVGSLTMEQTPDAWCTSRAYTVPGRLVRPGRNVLAVRVFSNIYEGGFIGTPQQMRLAREDGKGEPVPLAGPWRYKIEANFGLVPPPPPKPRGPGNPNSPHILFDSMIHPLLPYAIRGAIWYQGESNAGQARQYRKLFPLMIRSWRQAWKQGNFPFLFVQLANYTRRPDQPVESTWAELREAQTMTLSLPNTGMAVTIDIGDADNIHPANKQDVGIRLALPALAKVYGFKGLVHSGPVFRSMRKRRGRIRLEFDHVAGGLVARGGALKGFAVAGKDRKFVWAEAKIVGDRVEVWSDDVPQPAAVRYAWSDNPPCTLYNASELPASPFRTDSWPGITK